MLSYHHSSHTGNHADVLKHTVQSLIIGALKEKEKPFLCLDTHVGTSRYQLSGEHVERTGEYLGGVVHIWQQDDLPAELRPYISVVGYFNCSDQLHYYPGSPLIARQLPREQGSLQMAELYPSDFPLLRAEFQKDSHARIDKADSYQQLKAELPPVSRHGLILIDPPYKIRTDYQTMVTGTHEDYKRFVIGTYALWYPVVLYVRTERMIKELETTGIRKIPQTELVVCPNNDQRGVTASGMIVIDPPWKLEQQMDNVLSRLHSKLIPVGTGHATVSRIVPE